MDKILYSSLTSYFHTLELKGYMPWKDIQKLLILGFYRDFVFSDYRGIITSENYLLIEKALDCLYGTTCLIPYPDYLKMGKLHLGEITEMANRVKTIEETPVLKAFEGEAANDSDIIILQAEED